MGGITNEMMARGGPTLLDLGIAFFSGMAAAYCVGRSNLSAALPGVAISAALVPPIATTGIAISMGLHDVAKGSAILFSTNVVAVILGASFAMYAGGVRVHRGAQQHRWVQMLILTLLLSLAILAVPLTSVFFTKITQSTGAMYILSPELESAMRSRIEESIDVTHVELRAHRDGARYFFEIDLEAAAPPSAELADHLKTLASEELGKPVKVKLSTQLTVESH